MKSGVRQGETVENLDCKISLREAMITDLEFSDGAVIFAQTMGALPGALDSLSNESEPFGLKVAWIKTKIQTFLLSSTGT